MILPCFHVVSHQHRWDTPCDDGTVTLCALRAATALSRNSWADFGRPLPKRWCRTRVTVRMSRHHRGQTLYLSRRCGIPPLPLPPLKKSPIDMGKNGQEMAQEWRKWRTSSKSHFQAIFCPCLGGKRGLLGGLLGAVPFLCFSIESGCSRHCSQQSPQQSPLSRHSSQHSPRHSPRHFWDLGFLSPVAGGCDSYPCLAGGCLPFGFPFFPISGVWFVFHFMQAQQDPKNRRLGSGKQHLARESTRVAKLKVNCSECCGGKGIGDKNVIRVPKTYGLSSWEMVKSPICLQLSGETEVKFPEEVIPRKILGDWNNLLFIGEHSGDHNHQDFPKSIAIQNGRRIAIQMGGVLRYKWEEYWQYFPFLRA